MARSSSRARRVAVAGLSGLLALAGVLVAVDGSGSGAAPAPQVSTIFAAAARPAVAAANDTRPVEVGVKFSPDVAIYATGIRFYKGPGNTGQHIGTLWGPAGNPLRRIVFTKETASGWQTASFPTPVKLVAHANYLVSYHAAFGRYSYTYNYFTKTIDNGTVKMPASTPTSGNGVYRYGPFGLPVTAAPHAANYWVDTILSTTLPPPTTTTAATTPTTTKTTTTNATTPTTVKVTTTTTPVVTTGWPSAANTGVPAGVTLRTATVSTAGSGSCVVCPAGVTFSNSDGFDVMKCGVTVSGWDLSRGISLYASNGKKDGLAADACLTIRDSIIRGAVDTSYTQSNRCTPGPCGPLYMADSEIAFPDLANNISDLGNSNWYLWRVDVHGGRIAASCDGYCELHDSYLHDEGGIPGAHVDGFMTNGNNGSPILVDHNTLSCNTAPGVVVTTSAGAGGCSGDFNAFGDNSTISNVTVTNNFMVPGDSSYCAYTGASQPGKPFPNGNHLVWRNNVWAPGTSKKCGEYGPVADWTQNTGNIWCNNKWTTGAVVGATGPC